MAKENRILAVDVGSDTLKLAEFLFPADGEIILEKFAFAELEDTNGSVFESFTRKYPEMLAENKFTAKSVRLSISGQTAFARLSKLPPVSNVSGVQRVVEFEARQSIPYAMNEVVWGHQEFQRIVKTEEVIEGAPGEEPTRITTEHEEFETLIVAVKNDQLSLFCDFILSMGQQIRSVDIAPIALFNAAKAVKGSDQPVMLLNIGGRSSSLAVSDGGRVFLRTIPLGGDAITQQIAKDFSVSMAEAEDMKRRHGSVALGGAYESAESEMVAIISKISRNVMTRLHGEVTRSLNVWRSQHGGNPPAMLLLSGGGSMMQYVVEFFKEKLRLPVDYLSAFPLISLNAAVDKEKLLDVAPMFPELIGLALHEAARCPVEISLMPGFLQQQILFRRKAPYLYISAAAMIICFLVIMLGVRQARQNRENAVAAIKSTVEKMERNAEAVRKSSNKLRAVKSAYEKSAGIYENRMRWIKMMEELQKKMPPTMFFCAVEGAGDSFVSNGDSPAEERGFSLFGGEERNTSEKKTFSGIGNFEPVNAAALQEVKELRLKGYSLVLDKDLLEDSFRKAVTENSEFFSGSEIENDSFIPVRGRNNLTSFIIRLTLKEPIKK